MCQQITTLISKKNAIIVHMQLFRSLTTFIGSLGCCDGRLCDISIIANNPTLITEEKEGGDICPSAFISLAAYLMGLRSGMEVAKCVAC